MKSSGHVHHATLSILIISGLAAGQLLRGRTAAASEDSCANGELAEFVEVRRIDGAGPVETQRFWRARTTLNADPALIVYEKFSAEPDAFTLALEHETTP